MSDIQLATGIAILVSGYSQLHCGLICFHWKVIGRLAWFSSLTHLSCLTLLRNYLHNHPAQRHWRMLFMFVLVVMLVTAMVPTGIYDWLGYPSGFEPSPTKNDFAICYFSKTPSLLTMANLSMIGLVSSISFGFAIRVVKIHKSSLVSFVGRPRQKLSKTIRKLLWTIYNWRKSPASLRRRTSGRILYFPALALFLTLRLLLDHWSSMFFEVCRMVLTFKAELNII